MTPNNKLFFAVQYDYITDCINNVWDRATPNQDFYAFQEQIYKQFNKQGLLVKINRWIILRPHSGIPWQLFYPHFIIADRIMVLPIPDIRLKKLHFKQAKTYMRATGTQYSILICTSGKKLKIRCIFN